MQQIGHIAWFQLNSDYVVGRNTCDMCVCVCDAKPMIWLSNLF